jgi:hypothetical protein
MDLWIKISTGARQVAMRLWTSVEVFSCDQKSLINIEFFALCTEILSLNNHSNNLFKNLNLRMLRR